MKVSRSLEWRRIDALPRRTRSDIVDITLEFRRPGGTQTLLPIQSLALSEIEQVGGLFGAIGVGKGKTLISLLAPQVLKAERPLLLLPAKFIDKTRIEAAEYAKHWCFKIPEMKSYESLGRVNAAKYLDGFDLIIPDECHRLKHRTAAVTRRVLRYAREHAPKFVMLSGTITRRSLRDYWHLIALALGQANMPMPKGWPELEDWALALDPGVEDFMRVSPGVLCEWGPEDEPNPVTRARIGYQKRLSETPGVICTRENDVDATLDLAWLRLDPPKIVTDAVAELERTWAFDGWEYADALSIHRVRRQLALGFHYRWKVRPPPAWLEARSIWVKFVRHTIMRGRKYDSELQVAQACGRGELDTVAWHSWCDQRGFKPEIEVKWLSRFALGACAMWLAYPDPGLVWVEHIEFGEALATLTGIDFHHTKDSKPTPLIHAILSVRAFSEGYNLQVHWNRNLVTSCPSNGAEWEQLIGRTHRKGQPADEVTVEVLYTDACHDDAMTSALESAAYLRDTLGQQQKLLLTQIRG